MKRFAAILLALILTLSLVCTAGAEAPAKKLSVVSTIFPQYDWVCQVIGDNADAYKANAAAYAAQLSELDGRYQAAVANAGTDTVLFGDRFPFRYLVDDYGLTYYAAFAGCSAEASFETIVFLTGKVNELGLKAVCVLEGSDGKIASTVISNTDAKDQMIVTFDSLQSVTAQDVANGTTYLSAMEGNLEALTEALK